MAQLEADLWIVGGYYIDFDDLEQFRIIGPNNELYAGLIDIPKHKISIESVAEKTRGSVTITGAFIGQEIHLYAPAMDDMRTIRDLTSHPTGKRLSFLELRRINPAEAVPMIIRHSKKNGAHTITFQRNYGSFWYKTTWQFAPHARLRSILKPYKGYKLHAPSKRRISFTITAETNEIPVELLPCRLLPEAALDWSVFGVHAKPLEKFWRRTSIEICHLISWRKTSGDRFGTIFPRDWMESILLGNGDLQPETIDAMLAACLEHVDAKGHGWHEDAVGEYKYEHELAGNDLFDRKMIDIEPLYLLCLPYVSPAFWKNTFAVGKLRRVAAYLLKKAATKSLITFKKLPHALRTERITYYRVGDWRDSSWAYKQLHEVIAPFSVNAAHYPAALDILDQYAHELRVPKNQVRSAIKKWHGVKKMFQFTTSHNDHGYALALYDVRGKSKITSYQKMRIEHLDEAYAHYLEESSEQEVRHFAQLLLSPNGLFTPSGPVLVARHNSYGFTSLEYHGIVIWAKQAAFAVASLAKYRSLARKKNWKPSTRQLIDEALRTTSKTTLEAFVRLNAIPELHYDKDGETHFYTDQITTKGSMSKVQLWSAIGFRKMVKEYHDLLVQQQKRKGLK